MVVHITVILFCIHVCVCVVCVCVCVCVYVRLHVCMRACMAITESVGTKFPLLLMFTIHLLLVVM